MLFRSNELGMPTAGGEPKYGGKTLSEWAEGGLKSDSPIADHQQVVNIIYTVGTNAIPTVLGWLCSEGFPDEPSRRRILEPSGATGFRYGCAPCQAGHQVPESNLTNAAEKVVDIYKQNISESSPAGQPARYYTSWTGPLIRRKKRDAATLPGRDNTMTPIGPRCHIGPGEYSLASRRDRAFFTNPCTMPFQTRWFNGCP